MSLNINGENPAGSSVEVQRLNSSLPIAEGFWNNPGILYQNSIWVIQNVEDEEGEPIESERTLIKLDIESQKWSVLKTKTKWFNINFILILLKYSSVILLSNLLPIYVYPYALIIFSFRIDFILNWFYKNYEIW